MGYDPAYDVYLPIFYVLLPDKQQDTYWHLLGNVIMQCDLQVDPRYVTCDFEMGLLNAVRQQYAGVSVAGYLFHWKQALRRKMIDLRIPQETVSHVMTAGVTDVLTVIPIGEITEKGISFVRSRVDESGHRGKWDTFWRYFERTDLNESFTTAHPNLMTFMAVIKEKSKNYVVMLDDIRHHRQRAQEHGNLVGVELPAEYHRFCGKQSHITDRVK
ncbi:hypothetical protein PC121_g14520 [Phytophthora cactorum]|nr:hypothetical protein PC121_g14520 [Phytophthora cactorum]KAG4049296.1 hypothetical protein PC123_g15409 [Phytophthora cactorum]